jgi:Fe-S-cluster-containing hydrogenase component 2/CRP-like cAMP-binding protein
MPITPEPPIGLYIRDDDEDLFSRDINGQLVRLDAPTQNDYSKQITLQIDGQAVVVPLAEPLKDSSGNIILDLNGATTPRYTTIYDAAVKLHVKQPGDEAKIPIPTLCHQPHMAPVGVCRLCVVQIYGMKRGKRAAERKLLPACQHPVKEGMEVFTMNAEGPDGERVRQTVKAVTELLAADHLKPAPIDSLAPELAPFNELDQMTSRCGANAARLRIENLSIAKKQPSPERPIGRRQRDSTSPVFMVDHSACILCDRCVRACNNVMENNVIGRTGKGPSAGIGFDLNDWMGDSSCVQCGECMVSCPTSAITFKPIAQVKTVAKHRRAEVLPAADILRDPIFSGIPPKFLLWQQGLVIRRQIIPGEVLCQQGEAGNTAFVIKSGRLEARVFERSVPAFNRIHVLGTSYDRSKVAFRAELTPDDLIVGEMACVTGTPRTADIIALENGEVWEIRRNVLDRLMRVPALRERFDREYREKFLDLALERAELFKAIEKQVYREIVDFLRNRISFIRVQPGQVLFEHGDIATDMYFVRVGFVRIGKRLYGDESGVFTCGPGSNIGEIGLLGFSSEDALLPDEEVDAALKNTLDNAGGDLTAAIPSGYRSATCSALGPLELARLGRADFLELIRRFPILRRRFVEQSLARLRDDDNRRPFLTTYVDQGLYEGQSILVMDLERCTRCDECVRGCADQHGTDSHGVPLTRVIRDGLRFDKYLIATSCRSCSNAHCMVGCPVDAIHRGKHLQIVIEDHCIGCGLCASNCPYGSIFLMPNRHRLIDVADQDQPGSVITVGQPKAVNCDLCDAEGTRSTPQPRCVASCPHDAAFRMTGDELLNKIMHLRSTPDK